jgi:uncharacterized protein (TIGR00369 family)
VNAVTSIAQAPQKQPEIIGSQSMLESVAATEHPQCLLCSASNPFGLKLKFRVRADGSVVAVFPCRDLLQSYPETLHGGVISALLDAAMTNALFSIGIVAVTAELTVRFIAPVNLDRMALVRAVFERTDNHPLYTLRAELEQDQKPKATGSAKFFVKANR